MRRRSRVTVSLAALLLAFGATARAKSVAVQLTEQDVTARTLPDRGAYYVIDLPIPKEVEGKHLDAVLLEFYVDVAADASIAAEYTPLIEVFPLTEENRDGQPPRFKTAYPSSRPVPTGDGRRVLIDITDVVEEWIASPAANHGLVLGSFRGPKVGRLELRDDLLGAGKLVLATFYYQSRSGRRVE